MARYLPRTAQAQVTQALGRSPVVAIVGPRQCGKTTLARRLVATDSPNYFDIEDPVSLARLDQPRTALQDLSGVVVIDEVQHRPDLFPILRVLADREPNPARFLVLGSAGPSLLQQSAESLAGRIEYLESTFAAELPGLDRGEIRSWYGGYRWAGDEELYNPLGILRLFRERRFDGSWFDAAAPAFLIEMLMERGVDPDALDDRISDHYTLSLFDPDDIVMETLLFQTGCITITSTTDVGGETYYRLGYPNREVRRSLSDRLRARAVDSA